MVTEKAIHFHACQIATSNSVKQHKLRKLIAWLSDKEGRGMEFISLYIPREKSIDEIVAILKEESDPAVMKSESIRNRLQDARKNVIQRIKLQKEIPENGLAIFAGTFVANDSESEVLNVEELVPPEPITTYVYEVDDHFRLEPLREMLRDQKVVGLIAMDSKEASFGILDGERLEIIENITSGVPGKSGKGGWSQRRYERERGMELTHYFHRVAEHATKAFLENHKVTVLIVGGPGPTKEDFLKGDFLHYELKNMLLSTVDTQSASREGVREVLGKSSEALKNMCAPEQKRTVQRLLAELGKQDGLAISGLDSVLNALKNGEVEVVLMTDNTDMIEIVVMCKKCELSRSKIVNKEKKVQTVQEMISSPCERCNAVEYEVEEKDIIDVLEDVASQTDAIVEVISPDSEEKAKLTVLGGVAALLRYKPE
ncbi:MAG TPA: peptide chain release factor aRF-1 [candidate division Zixibacteria bacterium]|nr:peptide chain release factor aRF-1 [candidate division Zixibacteria bacterium]